MVNSKSHDSYLAQRGREYGVHHIIVEKSSTLTEALHEHLYFESALTEALIWLGAIYFNHQRYMGDPSLVLKKGDYLRVHSSPRRFILENYEAKKSLIFENDDFVVVNKPAGLPVHAIVDNYRDNLIQIFKETCNLDLKVTSRLDIPTCGLIVFAKTAAFQKTYNSYIRDLKIKKIYRAVTERTSGAQALAKHLIHFMEPSLRAPKKVFREEAPGALRCELQILNEKSYDDNLQEFRIQLLTGRTQQIRAQLSCEGYPILGDINYGSDYRAHQQNECIALQSSELKFADKFEFFLEEFDWQSQFKKTSI